MIPILYLLALAALAVGTAAIWGALTRRFPVRWLYWHYFARKPLVWSIFAGSTAWVLAAAAGTGALAPAALGPLALMALAIVLTYRMHQEAAFRAVDFPEPAADPARLPLSDGAEIAVVEHAGVARAYALDYVVHHHVVNDRFADRIVALTYCAMCRSIIAFDVTDIGPLFVGSFKNANMILADRRTRTFFQQATAQSIVGELHPHTLTMIPFQILPWGEVKRLSPLPAVASVTEHDLRELQLPIPGVWRKIVASEATPGLPARDRDRSFPARARVIGVPGGARRDVVYLKDEVLRRGVVENPELGVFLVASGSTVNAFALTAGGRVLRPSARGDGTLADERTGTVWSIRGKYLRGEIAADLAPVIVSDEYWFSWQLFHPGSELLRLAAAEQPQAGHRLPRDVARGS